MGTLEPVHSACGHFNGKTLTSYIYISLRSPVTCIERPPGRVVARDRFHCSYNLHVVLKHSSWLGIMFVVLLAKY